MLLVAPTVVTANKKGIVSFPSDRRISDRKVAHVAIAAPSHPDLHSEIDIPVRYDYSYSFRVSGSSGSSGMDGTNGMDGSSGSMGSIDPNNPSRAETAPTDPTVPTARMENPIGMRRPRKFVSRLGRVRILCSRWRHPQ